LGQIFACKREWTKFSAILESSQEKKLEHLFCRRISFVLKGVPDGYKELFERDSQKMSLKEVFLQIFLRNVFSEQIVAGNCNIMQHEIKLTDSRPIKQTLRRISIDKRAEVDEIIREIKSQKVIKEFFNPWIFLAILVKIHILY